jgi:predicted HAD superfamily Cof-like phosphohydrolase
MTIFQAAEELLRDFHTKFRHGAPEKPTLQDYPFELRLRLIVEEALEFVEACGYALTFVHTPDRSLDVIFGGETVFCTRCGAAASAGHTDTNLCEPRFERVGEPNWPEMIDALCDILYVTIGAGVQMGVPLSDFFREVHRSNMAKSLAKDAGGKTQKPADWKPPRIDELLTDLRAVAYPGRCVLHGHYDPPRPHEDCDVCEGRGVWEGL